MFSLMTHMLGWQDSVFMLGELEWMGSCVTGLLIYSRPDLQDLFVAGRRLRAGRDGVHGQLRDGAFQITKC